MVKISLYECICTKTCLLIYEELLSSLLAYSPLLLLKSSGSRRSSGSSGHVKYSIFSSKSKAFLLFKFCFGCLCLELSVTILASRLCTCQLGAAGLQVLSCINMLLSGLIFSSSNSMASSQTITLGFSSNIWTQRKHKSFVVFQGLLGFRLLLV